MLTLSSMTYRNFIMKSNMIIALILLSISGIAGADIVYKCKTPTGATMFQAEPCADAKAETKMNVVNAPASSGNKADVQANKRYYKEAMAAGNYDKAAAFAVSDQQKTAALAKQTMKNTKCANLQARAVQARADSKQRNGRWQHAADAKETIYGNECGQ